MGVFKCKLCGGTIEPSEGGIGICDSCGTKQTIPNTNDEKKMNLLDRANHFRMQNDFDKAISIYEQILEEDTMDGDIYYSLALCKYGITYVDDPKTKKKIPTINRMQNKYFTKNPDFEMAIEKAEPEQARLYREEGDYIDKVQAGIMDITKNEKPYDVFICYKETDDNGERTRDSVIGKELYDELTKKGFKVFFSRITLEGKLGIAYEPYIFSALNSSKVMVVIGTKKEYFNAVWVKNEWSRFLSLIDEGMRKSIIPVYKEMDPYDLPDELSNLQALNMDKLAFMQDLISGIEKLVKSDKGENSNDEVAQLLKRAKLFLEESKFSDASEYCEKALDKDAERAEIYIYKLLVEMKCQNINVLKNCSTYINKSQNFKYAMRFADDDQKRVLKDIENENLYSIAINSMKHDDFLGSINVLNMLGDFKESKNKIEECMDMLYKQANREINNNHFRAAIDILINIENYKDSRQIIEECRDRIDESIYNEANNLMNINHFTAAINKFQEVIHYSDSKDKIEECKERINESKYNAAYNLMNGNNFAAAIEKFQEIIHYSDSKDKIEECKERINESIYNEANNLMNSNNFAAAIEKFQEIIDYSDASDKIEACKEKINQTIYDVACRTMDSAISNKDIAQLREAIKRFEKIRTYNNSAEKIKGCEEKIDQFIYDDACGFMGKKNYEKAINVFNQIISFSDSKEKIVECEELINVNKYNIACQDMDAGKLNRNADLLKAAIRQFNGISSYRDSKEKIDKCETAIKSIIYNDALELKFSGSYNQAIVKFCTILDYMDSKNLVLQCVKKLDAMENPKYKSLVAQIQEKIEEENAINKENKIKKRKEDIKKAKETAKKVASVAQGAASIVGQLFEKINSKSNEEV